MFFSNYGRGFVCFVYYVTGWTWLCCHGIVCMLHTLMSQAGTAVQLAMGMLVWAWLHTVHPLRLSLLSKLLGLASFTLLTHVTGA